MLCDNCKERDSVVELIRPSAEGVSKIHLCEKCAAEQGVETTVATPKHPLGDFLKAVQKDLLVPGGEAGRCTFCGATMKDFRATGRLGCARCYVTFEGSLRELLRRVHGNSRHAGRRYEPPRPEESEKTIVLSDLRERLRRAIEAEQFELAADLRDRIRVLE